MRKILTLMFFCRLFAGCWTPGEICENLPKHRDRYPAGTAFYVAETEPRVRETLETALKKKGFRVTKTREEALLALVTEVLSWEYNEAGFSGFRNRDHMRLAIRVEEVKTDRVVSRTQVSLRSDFRILERYVERFAEEEARPESVIY